MGDGSPGYPCPVRPSHHCDAQGAQGVKGLSPELAWSPQVRSDWVYMWERTVMGISVHTEETETATPPYYYIIHGVPTDHSIRSSEFCLSRLARPQPHDPRVYR